MRKSVGITIFGREQDEVNAFRVLSPNFHITPTLINDAISADNAELAAGSQRVSIGHKPEVSGATILVLRKVGVKYVSAHNIGCDRIDTTAAERMGISVSMVAYSPDNVADYTLMPMLMAVRGAKPTTHAVAQQDFKLDRIQGKELGDTTVGVTGTGHIGQAIVRRLRGFRCRVLAYDNDRKMDADYVQLDELLKNSDIVTLHVPLCADTRHLIGQKQIREMKQGTFLINTGRGALIDTGALVEALGSGKLGGTALDMLESEDQFAYTDCSQKVPDHSSLSQFLRMPNVIIAPHTAYYTERVLQDTTEKTIRSRLNFERSLQYE